MLAAGSRCTSGVSGTPALGPRGLVPCSVRRSAGGGARCTAASRHLSAQRVARFRPRVTHRYPAARAGQPGVLGPSWTQGALREFRPVARVIAPPTASPGRQHSPIAMVIRPPLHHQGFRRAVHSLSLVKNSAPKVKKSLYSHPLPTTAS
ncbi:hypothetical protein KIL84_000848 [Mauremys mutica]|uniref:Uncharacterized protein n=1 Tax=Mauremys mutica TaxID=74926 RepID=A0A9D3WZS3_9SAUR|nr:hypothetical protein KIL84_000848 [Mauremys mutica]